MSSQARRPRNIIVFQHDRLEHPGIFRSFFREDGFQLHTVEIDEGEPIPSLDGFDLMVVMGGPQDVWEEDQYAWLHSEKAAIQKLAIDGPARPEEAGIGTELRGRFRPLRCFQPEDAGALVLT